MKANPAPDVSPPPASPDLDLIAAGVLTIAADGSAGWRVQAANRHAAALLQMDVPLAPGPLQQVLPAELAGPLADGLRACREQAQRVDLECRLGGPGRPQWLRLALAPVLAEGGGLARVVVTFTDISGRKQAETRILASELKFEGLVEGSIQGIMVLREERALFCNAACATILGLEEPAQVLALSNLTDLLHPDDRDDVLVRYAEVMAGHRATRRISFRTRRPDGTELWLEAFPSLVLWEGESALQLTLNDVTERVRATEALEESEERYRTLVEHAQLSIVVHRDGQPLFVNTHAVHTFGFASTDEYFRHVASVAPRPLPLVPEEQRAFLTDKLAQIQRGELAAYYHEGVLRGVTGQEVHFSSVSHRILWDGQPAVLTSLLDRSEQARLHAELQRNEALLRSVVTNAPVILWAVDADGISTLSEGKGLVAQGLAPGETVGRSVFDVYADYPDLLALVRRALTGESVMGVDDTRGAVFERRIEPVRAPDGTVTGAIGVSVDITERARAEAELRRSQSLLQTVFDALPLGLAVKDRERRFIMINARQAQAVDFPTERLGTIRDEDITWLEEPDKQEIIEQDTRVLETGERVESTFYPLTLRNGRSVRVNMHRVPVRDADGNIFGLVAVTQNVTALWEAQQEAQRRQMLLEATFNALPVWASVKDLEGRYLLVSRVFADAVRFPLERMGEVTDEDIHWLHPEHGKGLRELDRQVIANGRRMEIPAMKLPYSVARRDRDHEWWHVIKAPVRDPSGQPIALVSISMDVTEAADVQETLRASEERYRALVESAQIGITVHVDGRGVFINPYLANLLGYERPEDYLAAAAHREPLAHVVESERAESLEMRRRVQAGEQESYVKEGTLERTDGTPLHIQSIARRIQWEGRPAVLTAILDLTQLKRAEATLRASEERYRALVEGSVQGIGVFAAEDARALFVNEAMLRLAGAPSAQAYVGKVRLFDNLDPAYAKSLHAKVDALLAGEREQVRDELPLRRGDGTAYWAEFQARRVDWDGQPGVQLTALDITDRKRAEEALKDRQAVLTRQNEVFRRDLSRRRERTEAGLVAESPTIRRVLREAEMVARSRVPVLIEGETGTGKEVVAEFIHRHSDRADQLLSVVNCGALTENLMDAELFGHERGAFTGATDARAGMIEIADHGTLFLDEIGDLPPTGQVRLLRFLERGVIRRVGSTRERKVDVRILAATHRSLKAQVQTGAFREDLYHRLLVIRLEVPPLRERIEDILPLAEHFLAASATESHLPARTLSDEARLALTHYGWPGNVRELSHAMQRAVLTAQLEGAETILPAHLDLPVRDAGESVLLPIKEVTRRAERRHVMAALRHFNGNRKRTAESLGISERHLYRLLD